MTENCHIDSERASLEAWEAVDQAELPDFGGPSKTKGDVETLLPLLSKRDRILDLGCGWGRVSLELARKGFQVTGIDLSPNLIRYAREVARREQLSISYDLGSMLDLPYAEETFDRVICLWGVFSHLLRVEEQVKGINEIHRILRPNGLAFIEMSNGELKRHRETRQNQAFGPENRITIYRYKDFRNTLYIHDRDSLTRIAEKSDFDDFAVKFRNINHKRRLVMWLRK